MPNRPHPSEPVLEATTTNNERLPGWPEIVAGLGAAIAVTVGLVLVAPLLPTEPVAYGLVLAAWSVAVAFVGFGAAFALRFQSLSVFGVRRTTWRWVLIGLAAGIVAFLLKGAVNAAIIALGFNDDAQAPFQTAGNGGAFAIILTLVLL